MTYTIELGRDATSYGDVIQMAAWLAMDRQADPAIFDLEYTATHDSDASMNKGAKGELKRFPAAARKWLKASREAYRIEAIWVVKDAPESAATRLIGGPCVTYGYVFNVVFEDRDTAMLFKLTFGGAA